MIRPGESGASVEDSLESRMRSCREVTGLGGDLELACDYGPILKVAAARTLGLGDGVDVDLWTRLATLSPSVT